MENIKKLKILAEISKYTGFTKLCYFFNSNRKKVVAYHNIIPDEFFDNSLHLSHSIRESSFKKQLQVIQKRFDMNLDISNKKSVTLSFDDGYDNQFSIASKIMDEKNIKGYFFCVANLVGSNEALIMDKLQYWFSYVPYGKYYLKAFNVEIDIENDLSRKIQWGKISSLIDGGISLSSIERAFDKVYEFQSIEFHNADFYKLRFQGIGLEDLQKMKNSGHKIGAHSAKHERLSSLSCKRLKKDIDFCAKSMGDIYNTDVFCYPYGSYKDINKKTIELLKEKNFKSAFSYCNSPLAEKVKYNDYFMPRIFLPDTDDEDIINFIMSGAKNFIRFRRLMPKW